MHQPWPVSTECGLCGSVWAVKRPLSLTRNSPHLHDLFAGPAAMADRRSHDSNQVDFEFVHFAGIFRQKGLDLVAVDAIRVGSMLIAGMF